MPRKKKLEVVGELNAVPVEKILTGGNDRKFFDQGKLQELASSIAEKGLLQAITVRPVTVEGEVWYELIAGERRYRAIMLLGWVTVPATVAEMTDEEASVAMLMENTGRADLLPMEEAFAYQRRANDFAWPVEKIAEKAGVSPDRVKKRMKLTLLCDELHPLVNSGQLPLGHAEALTALDHDKQRAAVRVFSRGNGISLREFQVVIAEMNAVPAASLFDLEQFFILELETKSFTLSGKNAQVNVPTSATLPSPQATGKDGVGDVMFNYIRVLQSAGHMAEAEAIGNLFSVLVKGNWVKLPSVLQSERGV